MTDANAQKPTVGKAAHKVIIDGTPASGVTKMGHKGPGGRPANQPPKASTYFGAQQQQIE
jgi:hypothetical protein